LPWCAYGVWMIYDDEEDNEPGLITLSDKKVTLLPYHPRPLKEIPLLSDNELLANTGGVLMADTEVYPNYYLCNFKCIKTGKYIVFERDGDKYINQRKLSWVMHNYRTVWFNGIKYDLPIVWFSFVNQNLPDIQRLSNALILQNMWHAEAQKEFKFKIFPTNILDLIEVSPLKGSLKLYGARLHSKRLQELPFPPNVALSEEQKPIIKQYNLFSDLEATHLLYDFMKERIELREAMSAEYRLDLHSKSDAQIAEAVLIKEVTTINGERPKKPGIIPSGFSFNYKPPAYLQYQTPELKALLEKVKQVKFTVGDSGKVKLPEELTVPVKLGTGEYRLGNGGLHSSEKNVCYLATPDLSIVDRDVTSYYPRLTTTLGLYPQSMGPAFLVAYERIIQSRIAAKAAKRTTEANGKKIVVNGAGGKYSDPFSVLYDPVLTIQQNVTGQLDLLLFAEILYLCEFTVISANTDGIVTLVPKDKEAKYLECAMYWEAVTGFQTEETRYSKYYARDVNSYFAVKEGAKSIKDIKVKGPYSEVGSQSGTQLDTNPTAQICSDAVKQMLLDGTPIEQTIYKCKDFTRFVVVRQAKAPGAHKDGEYLGKVVRWYFSNEIVGTINPVAANNIIATSEGARPCMDLPESWPTDIDYNKYIALAIEILYDINYLKKPQQQRLF